MHATYSSIEFDSENYLECVPTSVFTFKNVVFGVHRVPSMNASLRVLHEYDARKSPLAPILILLYSYSR